MDYFIHIQKNTFFGNHITQTLAEIIRYKILIINIYENDYKIYRIKDTTQSSNCLLGKVCNTLEHFLNNLEHRIIIQNRGSMPRKRTGRK